MVCSNHIELPQFRPDFRNGDDRTLYAALVRASATQRDDRLESPSSSGR